MSKFAIKTNSWFNCIMKSTVLNVKEKLIEKYLEKDTKINLPKSTDINVLLNRVKTNQKNESRRKLYFSAAASTGLLLFGLIIF
tara:strand:- start:133 stop:384 length:252 start_codon:yes stop_codon:yes gene_type:complete